MRVRAPFVFAFLFLCSIAAFLGLAPIEIPYDKAVHFITFFLISLTFYWAVDVSRRRAIQLTLGVCTLFGGIVSECAQSLTSYRQFDVFDILYNILGSLIAICINAWYHKGMLERRRQKKYRHLVTDEPTLPTTEFEVNDDIELEENPTETS